MHKIKFRILLVWYWIWGHILGAIFYERKYYYGKWFKGRLWGVGAPGWKWICVDWRGRRFNPHVPWPVSPLIKVGDAEKIHFHPDDLNNFQGIGNYFQAFNGGEIFIGKGTWIAPNVGIITTNHMVGDVENHEPGTTIHLGERCWIGMNSMILPGVTLGDDTVVGAGSVVTWSFPEGHCVIAGTPAKILRKVER